jgi:PleD family two-component response regulator
VTDGLTGLYNRGYLFQRLTEEEDLAWAEPGLRVTVSGGVCEYAGLDIDAFVDAADRKLYEAKSAGRDRVIG